MNETKSHKSRMETNASTFCDSFISEKQRAMHGDASDVGSVINRGCLPS